MGGGDIQNASAQGLADPQNHRVIAVEDGDFCEYGSWNLVFFDEFDDDSLNTDKWLRFYPYCDNQDQCMASRTHSWPDELQIFSDDNVVMTGEGTVKLIAKKGILRQWYSANSVYTSGMLHSRFKFGRGRFEIRCKVPKSTSSYLWPAFWLFGGNGACSEIDIMEILWTRSNQYHHALHRYNSSCTDKQASEGGTIGVTDLSADFHIYRAEWDKWFVNFYVDDVLLHRSCRIYDLLTRPVSSCHVPAGIYIQNQAFPAQDAQMSIIVDLALHKGLYATPLGGPATIPDLPAEMEIDYIRVYQR